MCIRDRPIFILDALRAVVHWSRISYNTEFGNSSKQTSIVFTQSNPWTIFHSSVVNTFSCCLFLYVCKYFVKYSIYIFVFCSVKTMCVWRIGGHYTPSCWKIKGTWRFEVYSFEGIFFLSLEGNKRRSRIFRMHRQWVCRIPVTSSKVRFAARQYLSLIHIWRCRRS